MFIEDLLCVDTEQSDVQITKNSYETEFLAKKKQLWSIDGKLMKIHFEDKCLGEMNIKTK